jgi:hypothetical protein
MLQVGEPHPDRNAQFEFMNEKAKEFIGAGEPVISVDTKKIDVETAINFDWLDHYVNGVEGNLPT